MDFEFILAYKLDLKYPCKPDYFDFPVFKYWFFEDSYSEEDEY
jgi:hypothetical protein